MTMRAMVVPVDGIPVPVEVRGLRDMQRVVGGDIEPVPWVFDDEPAVYVNGEGKYTCEPNRALYASKEGERWDGTPIHEGDLLDIAYGPMLCVGFDPDTGESRDITDDEADRVAERFGEETVGSGLCEETYIRLTGGRMRSARSSAMSLGIFESGWQDAVYNVLANAMAEGVVSRNGLADAARHEMGEER